MGVVCVGAGFGVSVNCIILKLVEKNECQEHSSVGGRNVLCLVWVGVMGVYTFVKSVSLYTCCFSVSLCVNCILI